VRAKPVRQEMLLYSAPVGRMAIRPYGDLTPTRRWRVSPPLRNGEGQAGRGAAGGEVNPPASSESLTTFARTRALIEDAANWRNPGESL